MSVTFNPFVSKYGFKSDSFEVNSSGNVLAENITVNNNIITNSIDASLIKLDGITLFNSEAESLQIEKDLIVSEGSTPYLSIVNGQVSINNRLDTVGIINNINIGNITPGTGAFTTLSSLSIMSTTGNFTDIFSDSIEVLTIESNTSIDIEATNSIIFTINGVNKGNVSSNGINIPVLNTTINNTTIGAITPSTAAFTSATVANQPTSDASLTRKDYVDNKISAFSIAFGI